MFEVLKTLSADDVIAAVYEASLRLDQPARLAWIKGTNIPLSDDPLASQLLAEIEATEGRHPADLSKEERGRYIAEMDTLMWSRIWAERPPNPPRGEEILKEMRAAYSWPHYGRRVAG